MNFVTKYTYVKDEGSKNELPSLTKPGMTYTPEQLLARFAQGHQVPDMIKGIFTGDKQIPDIHSMDLVDQKNTLDMAIDDFKRKQQQFQIEQAQLAEQRRKYNQDMKDMYQGYQEYLKTKNEQK
jgi:FtsZ-binding cell division protein ZapB